MESQKLLVICVLICISALIHSLNFEICFENMPLCGRAHDMLNTETCVEFLHEKLSFSLLM